MKGEVIIRDIVVLRGSVVKDVSCLGNYMHCKHAVPKFQPYLDSSCRNSEAFS